MEAVDQLIAAGRWADAAAAAEAAGDPARAAELFARIWQFDAAARCARAAGDRLGALRHAIEGRDDALTRALIDELAAAGEADARAALRLLEARRRAGLAGELAERLGDLAGAAAHYRADHRELDAARLYAAAGRDRDAGLLYERVIARGTSAERGVAHLRLGELLAGRLQHDAAAGHLQAAMTWPEHRGEAAPALAVALHALGLLEAARGVHADARRADPTLPASLEELVAARRPTRPPPTDGRELVAGRYRLDRLLGAGASGRVHRAHDEVTGREVALKLLSAVGSHGGPAWERFAREATIAANLRHPNLVEVYEVSAERGYLAMELMLGGSLDARLPGPLPFGQVRRLALELLAGLELAHQRGVIHRDVKPANVFFDARGTAKLGDFGVAHLLDLGQTQTGGLIGTLAYMAPEQITGAPLTVAADLYAVGVTLFEALAGRPPFLGPDFVAQHLGEAPPPLAELMPEAAAWAALLERLLAKDPDARPATAGEVARAIQAIEILPQGALVLPRARTRTESGSRTAVDAPASQEPRFRFETPLTTHAASTLSRAVDRVLDRSVVIERFPGGLDPATERRVLALARAVSPFFQRVLSLDRAAGVVVYEAPAGSPLADLVGRGPTARVLIRLLKRLARALAVLHDAGDSHGALGPSTILVDDLGNPSILASGLGPPGDASPPADCAAVVDAIAVLAGGSPGLTNLVTALAPGLSPEARRALPLAPPSHGEELYTFADALEVALLRS